MRLLYESEARVTLQSLEQKSVHIIKDLMVKHMEHDDTMTSGLKYSSEILMRKNLITQEIEIFSPIFRSRTPIMGYFLQIRIHALAHERGWLKNIYEKTKLEYFEKLLTSYSFKLEENNKLKREDGDWIRLSYWTREEKR